MSILTKSIPIYIKLYTNKVEVIRLDNGEAIEQKAINDFSNSRLVIADFTYATELIQSIIKGLIPKTIFSKRLTILIQQMEKFEGGLSPIETRVISEIGERIGGKRVKVIYGTDSKSLKEALLTLEL